MRILGRALFALVIAIALGLSLVVLVAATGGALRQRLAPPSIAEAERSIAYALGEGPTTFVFSRPQTMVRIITNAQLTQRAEFPRYGIIVEALGTDDRMISRQRIFARSIQLFVRDTRGRTAPRTFLLPDDTARISAGDIAIIDYGRPVAAIRIAAATSDTDVQGIVARVQERRPVSRRKLAIGWDRLGESEQEKLAAGSALPAALTGEQAQQRLLVTRWHPVGPAGVLGRDYSQIALYERAGQVFSPRAATR